MHKCRLIVWGKHPATSKVLRFSDLLCSLPHTLLIYRKNVTWPGEACLSSLIQTLLIQGWQKQELQTLWKRTFFKENLYRNYN